VYQREKRIKNREFTAEIIPKVDDLCDEALTLVDEGDVAKGESCLEALRVQYPNYHTVLYGIGVCHCIKGQMDEAIGYLERAVEIFPLLAHAHFNLGSAYCQKFDVEKAVKAFQAAIEVDGEGGPVGQIARERLDKLEAMARENGINLNTYISNQRVFNRAFAALHEKRFQVAIDLFEQVLAVEKGHVQSYGNMGLAYAGLGNKTKALECLGKALELDSEYEPALVNRFAIERLKDGEVLTVQGIRAVDYYTEFKIPGRSYIKELTENLTTAGKLKSVDTP
jgi:tetratricopeptide (TPR) repeat protein